MRTLLLAAVLALLPSRALAAAPAVRASPERVVLGRDGRVTVEVTLPEGAVGPPRAAASRGVLVEAVKDAGGQGPVWRFVYTPPEVRYPLLVLLQFWVDAPGGAVPEVATLPLPLYGRTQLEVETDPRAEVHVEVAGERFGPVTADRRGRVRVPVEVPPGVREARVLARAQGVASDRRVELEVPPERPLVVALGPSPLRPGGRGWLLVTGDEPLKAADVELDVRGGKAERDSAARALFRVTPEAGAERVSVLARAAGTTAGAEVPVEAPPADAPPTAPALVVAVPSPADPRLSLFATAGAFFAGGANRGPALALGAGWRLPLLGERVHAELEVGLRRAGLSRDVPPLGAVDSHVTAVPIRAALRAHLLARGRVTLHGRAGVGLAPFRHALEAGTQPELRQGGLGPALFGGVQAGWTLGRVSPYLELAGDWAPARTAQLRSQLGGVVAQLGVRLVP